MTGAVVMQQNFSASNDAYATTEHIKRVYYHCYPFQFTKNNNKKIEYRVKASFLPLEQKLFVRFIFSPIFVVAHIFIPSITSLPKKIVLGEGLFSMSFSMSQHNLSCFYLLLLVGCLE